MLRILFLALCPLAVLGTARADTVIPTDRVTNGVNVRADPRGEPSPVVGSLRAGEEAEFLDEVPHYFQVRLSSGVEGFVSKSWTRRVAGSSSGGAAPATAVGQFPLAIHFIDVGQGDSTLIACPDGTNILVDAGSKPQTVTEDALRDYLLPFFDRNGERKLETLVVTHPDEDHYNLLIDTLEDVPIERVYRVGKRTNYTDKGVWDWLSEFGSATTTLESDFFNEEATPNADIECGTADVWIMAAAVEASDSPKNAMSIVLMVRFGDFEAVLTGDATHDTEEVIVGRYSEDWLDVDVLKIGHHGSLATSTSEEWAAAIKPEIAVASAGAQNSFGHPRREVVERLEPFTMDTLPHPMRYFTGTLNDYTAHEPNAYSEGVYSTAASGHVIVTTEGSGFEVTTAHWDE